MAYGYGSWSQIAAPKTSSSSTVFSSAGDIFNKAIEAGQSTVDKYLQYKEENLASAKEENLANLKLQLLGKAQQGLGAYDPVQDFYTAQNIQGVYDKFIDPLAAAQAVQAGREQAVSSTVENLKSKYLTDYQKQLETNASAYAQTAAEDPSLNQYIGIDESNNIGFTPAAFNEKGELKTEAENARQKFGQIATKYGFSPETKPFDSRKALAAELTAQGAKTTEVDSITSALEDYQATRTNLPANLQSQLDLTVSNATQLKDDRLAALEKNQADILGSAAMTANSAETVSKYLNQPDPLKAFLKENYADTTWFTSLWRDSVGGQDAYDMVKGVINSLPADQRPTESQVLVAMAQSGELEGPYLFGWGNKGINPEEFKANVLAFAQNAQGTNDAAIKQRLASYEANIAAKQDILKNYQAEVSNARRQIASEAGLQDLKGNSAFLRDVFARYQATTGSAPTSSEKKQLEAAVSRVSATGSASGKSDKPATEVEAVVDNAVKSYVSSGRGEPATGPTTATATDTAPVIGDPNSFQNLAVNEWISNFVAKQARDAQAGFNTALDKPSTPLDFGGSIPNTLGKIYGSIGAGANALTGGALYTPGTGGYDEAGVNVIPPSVPPTRTDASPALIEALRRNNVGPNPNVASDPVTLQQALARSQQQAAGIPAQDLNIAPQIAPNNLSQQYQEFNQQSIPERTAELARLERLQGTLFEVMRSLQNIPTRQLQQLINSNASIVVKTAAEAVLRNR